MAKENLLENFQQAMMAITKLAANAVDWSCWDKAFQKTTVPGQQIADRIDKKIIAMMDSDKAAQERRIRGQKYDIHHHEWCVK